MKSKSTTFVAVLFLSIWTLFSNAQTTVPQGKIQLIEFTNATAKFIVPEGKIWYITNVFSSSESAKQETNYIILKMINNTTFGNNGPKLSNFARNYFSFPVIFPEKKRHSKYKLLI
jgi:hypothetical protein